MKLSPAAAQALAAEYALGTLGGRARRRFERMAAGDASLAALARRWELALAPLAEDVPAEEPPGRVWAAIEARIATGARTDARASFWRAFGLAAAGLATVLLAFFLWMPGALRDEPVFVAVLSAQESGARAVVSLHEPDMLRVRIVKPWKDVGDKSLELWVLPREGAPRSLGLVANGGETTIRMASGDPRMAAASALAVSLEPHGGSPTKRPTGPVLCSGAIATVRRT